MREQQIQPTREQAEKQDNPLELTQQDVRRPLPMSDEYAGFLLLNIFDLFLTGYIFRHGGEEVNPVGVWVLNRYGMSGFAFSKIAMVAFVILVIETIYRLRPPLARRLLNAANFMYLGVILWECVLLLFR